MPTFTASSPMRFRAALLASAVTMGLGLSACQQSPGFDDPVKLREAVLKRAPELGSTQVAQLSLSGAKEGKTSAMLTVRNSDGSAVTKPVDGDGSGMTETTSRGIPADQLPYEELAKVFKDSKEKCGVDGATASVKVAVTGKVFIDARCLDIKTGAVTQLIDGTPSTISSLDGAQDIDTVLHEASYLLGPRVASITIVYNSVIEQLGPHVQIYGTPVKAGAQTCAPMIRREVSGISFEVECKAPSDKSGTEIDINGLTGKQISDALAVAYKQLGLTDRAGVSRIAIINSGGKRTLVVTPVEMTQPVMVPLD